MGPHAGTPDQEPQGLLLGLPSRRPEGKLEKGPEMSMKMEADLGLAVHWIQHPSSPPMRTTVLFDLLEMVGKV